jgi:alanyl-tRNA synthetase
MSGAKLTIIRQFQKTPDRYWRVALFDQLGFKRRHCINCGKYFWSIEPQATCNDSSCRPYDFIGNPPTKRTFDYIDSWKAIEDFFKTNGHTSVPRYPVVCRWFPNLYFNIASIVSFMRPSNGTSFEFPYNPLIIPQSCMRFNDIPQVGVSGRHFTNFIMVGQHSAFNGKNGYWKDKCIELDYKLLTDVFGIRPEEINFIEDVWSGPSAFGSSLEYHVAGLEIGNAVFTEFAGTLDNFREMPTKIIDMGAGLERFAWLSTGTSTAYDAIYGDVIEKIRTQTGIEWDVDMLLEYSRHAGALNIDEVADIEKVRAKVAHELGISTEEMVRKLRPMQAVYAIADHTKTLALAITDGMLPSNIGGGYNLRVILRRALSFIDEFNLPLELCWIVERHAKHLKELHPELMENVEKIKQVLDIEENRYRSHRDRARNTLESVLAKPMTSPVPFEVLEKYYESDGITPEMFEQVAKELGKPVNIPADFYVKFTDRHMKEKETEKKALVDVTGLPETVQLFREKEKLYGFNAKVLRIIDNKWIVLDSTAFWPRGGGAEPDHGSIGGRTVYDVEKVGDVIIHAVEDASFEEGEAVECKLNAARRKQIVLHHTATHIVNGAARQLLGEHIWQAGSKKDVDKTHLDVTHHTMLTEKQVEQIEKLANDAIKKKLPVIKSELPRNEAEKKYGFRLYQGGAVPGKNLRITDIKGWDVEACGGLHVDNCSEVEQIIITKVERPQDGIIRFVYVAGPAANDYLAKSATLLAKCAKLMRVPEAKVPAAVKKLFTDWKKTRKQLESLREKKAEKRLKEMKFVEKDGLRFLIAELPKAGHEELKEVSRKLSGDNTVIVLLGVTDRVNVFASAGPTAVKAGIDVGSIVKQTCQGLGGGGGGQPGLAQGTGIKKGEVEDAIVRLKEQLGV